MSTGLLWFVLLCTNSVFGENEVETLVVDEILDTLPLEERSLDLPLEEVSAADLPLEEKAVDIPLDERSIDLPLDERSLSDDSNPLERDEEILAEEEVPEGSKIFCSF